MSWFSLAFISYFWITSVVVSVVLFFRGISISFKIKLELSMTSLYFLTTDSSIFVSLNVHTIFIFFSHINARNLLILSINYFYPHFALFFSDKHYIIIVMNCINAWIELMAHELMLRIMNCLLCKHWCVCDAIK